jgi:hypothetical protein
MFLPQGVVKFGSSVDDDEKGCIHYGNYTSIFGTEQHNNKPWYYGASNVYSIAMPT